MQGPLLVENHKERAQRENEDTAINQSSSCITIIIILSDISSLKGSSWLSAQLWSMNPFPLAPVSVIAKVDSILLPTSSVTGRIIRLDLRSLSLRTERPSTDAADTELGHAPSRDTLQATQPPQPPVRNEAVGSPTIAIIARFCIVVVNRCLRTTCIICIYVEL
jgi:hypothetical protein